MVVRSFPGPGSVQLAPGDRVNTSDWPHGRAARLVEQRFLRPAQPEETPQQASGGRSRPGRKGA